MISDIATRNDSLTTVISRWDHFFWKKIVTTIKYYIYTLWSNVSLTQQQKTTILSESWTDRDWSKEILVLRLVLGLHVKTTKSEVCRQQVNMTILKQQEGLSYLWNNRLQLFCTLETAYLVHELNALSFPNKYIKMCKKPNFDCLVG